MAVFRVERNRGYTVMSNHHLRNRDLTLKAKGLLSQMLSLPDNWDYPYLKKPDFLSCIPGTIATLYLIKKDLCSF